MNLETHRDIFLIEINNKKIDFYFKKMNVNEKLISTRMNIYENKDIIFILKNIKILLENILNHFDLSINKEFHLDIHNSPHYSSDFVFHFENKTRLKIPNWTFNSFISNNEIVLYKNFISNIVHKKWINDTLYWRGIPFDFDFGDLNYKQTIDVYDLTKSRFLMGLYSDSVIKILKHKYNIAYQNVFNLNTKEIINSRILFDIYTSSNVGPSYLKLLLWFKKPIIVFKSPVNEFFTDKLEHKKHVYFVSSIDEVYHAVEEIRHNKYLEEELQTESYNFAKKYLSKEAVFTYIRDRCLTLD